LISKEIAALQELSHIPILIIVLFSFLQCAICGKRNFPWKRRGTENYNTW